MAFLSPFSLSIYIYCSACALSALYIYGIRYDKPAS
jgi:hypothetical protein